MMKSKPDAWAELIKYSSELSEGLGEPKPISPGYDKGRIEMLAAHVSVTRDFFEDEDGSAIFDEVLKALNWSREDLGAVRHVAWFLRTDFLSAPLA